MRDHTLSPTTLPPVTGAAMTLAEPTPAGAVRLARIGGTIAELAAAAISAHTLYHLGGQLDLGPAAAWLLPAALDTYAFTALAVGYGLPADHPGPRPVLRNARLAFALTLGCNCLDHFLSKAGRLIDPTFRDLLLVAVATLPPLVVERLLNLQSVLAGTRAASSDHARGARSGSPNSGRPPGQDTLGQHSAVALPTATDQPQPDQQPTEAIPRPDWTGLGAGLFGELSTALGRRPSAREFQAALAAEAKVLIAEGRLAAGARPPSVTTAKRIRAALEADPRRMADVPGQSTLSQTQEPQCT